MARSFLPRTAALFSAAALLATTAYAQPDAGQRIYTEAPTPLTPPVSTTTPTPALNTAPASPYDSPTVQSLGSVPPAAGVVADPLPPTMADVPEGPQVQQSGEISYINGGVGDGEKQALEAVQAQYNLRVLSASKRGEFVGDTRIIIADRKGNQLVDVAGGPLFLFKLPAGSYSVEAINEGRSKKVNTTVGKTKQGRIHLSW